MSSTRAHASSIRSVWWVAYFGCALSLPTWINGFPAITHDGELHQLWLHHFFQQLHAGDLYPRWLTEMNGGRGSPVFFFYPPVPYFLTSVITASFPDLEPVHRLGWGASLALIGSGLAAYLWLTSWLDDRSSVLGAMAYMTWPYHLAVDLYQRGAFGEFWAFVWLPLVLWAVQRIIDDKPAAISALAMAWALLTMTHPPTALIMGGLPLLWAICRAMTERCETIVRCVLGQTLGFGLAAIYLVPAWTERDQVQMEAMHEGSMHYAQSFFLPLMWEGQFKSAHSSFGAALFPILLLGLVVTLVLGLATVWLREAAQRETILWLGMTLLSALMTVPLSDCVYRALPPLQLIQFPWRFGVIQVLGGSALVALFVRELRRRGRDRIVLLFAVVWVSSTLVYSLFFSGELSGGRSSSTSDRVFTARDAPEYKPRWVPDRPFFELTESRPRVRLPLTNDVLITTWLSRRICFQITSQQTNVLELDRYYYPGWRAVDGVTIGPSLDGLLRVVIPPSRREVELTLAPSEGERLGGWISAGALGVVLSQLAQLLYRRRA